MGPEQRARLLESARPGPIVSGERSAAAARARRVGYQEAGRELARSAGRGYVAASMLYWAEGSKGRNTAVVTNADVELLRFFADCLREQFRLTDDRLRLRCNLFSDHEARQTEIEQHWLDALRLPRSSLQPSTIDRYSKYSVKKRTNKLPHGTGRLTVHSTQIVQTLYGSIQEPAGFDRPSWAD